ncbi:MAG: DEAD/DEAH box helicase, partial [Ardenticatenaceae bacterium]
AEDVLTLQFDAGQVDSRQEPVVGLPNVALARARNDGRVVGVIVQSVQDMILQGLVRDIFFQMLPTIAAASGEGRRGRGEEREAVSVPPVEEVPAALEQAVEKPPRRRRRKRRREGAAPEVNVTDTHSGVAEPVEAPAPEVATPALATDSQAGAAERVEAPAPDGERASRGRGRTKAAAASEKKPESVEVVRSDGSQAVESVPEAAPKAARKRRRRGKAEAATTQDEGEQGAEAELAAARREAHQKEERQPKKSAPIPGLGAPESFAFMGMHPFLGQIITALGYEEPTPIQRRAVPEIMAGRDVIGLAQTGTGKTLAFLIPGLHRLLAEEQTRHRPRLLVLAPTRELAVQVTEEAELLATHTDLRVTTIYGGVSMQKQISALRRGVDVIVATPGRLLDHLRRGNVNLHDVEIAVLD